MPTITKRGFKFDYTITGDTISISSDNLTGEVFVNRQDKIVGSEKFYGAEPGTAEFEAARDAARDVMRDEF